MIGVFMPSTIGHALTGIAVVWTADLAARRSNPGRSTSDHLLPICAALAAAPDLDLLLPGAHRSATHSVTAMVLVTIVAALVTGQVTRWRTALLCGISYGSHLVLDWLAADNYPPRGIQLLWPFSDRWFISDLDLFRQTARQQFLTAPIIRQNLVAVAQELCILLPVLALIWWARVRQQRAIKN
jgi:inner membrane protein